MVVLSLFDGISCGQVALKELGIPVSKYYASEIDKNAIKVTKHHFPNTIQLGDINSWRDWELNWGSIDLIMGGSPCQGFSFAGKELAFDDPRSKLFFTFLDILNYCKGTNSAVKFLLENVRMREEFSSVITKLLKVSPELINSKHFSLQNRERLYWFNWDLTKEALPNYTKESIKDKLEIGHIDDKYLLKTFIEENRSVPPKEENTSLYIGRSVGRRIDPITGKRSDNDKNIPYKQYWEPRIDGLCGTLTTVTKDNYLGTYTKALRRLTPLEYERFQTLPDNYTKVEGVSESSRYKLVGNGWNVSTIENILNPLREVFQ
jgi:DNA (cytosine-5)-methyltransferase 3A